MGRDKERHCNAVDFCVFRARAEATPLLHTQTHAEMIGLVFALRAI